MVNANLFRWCLDCKAVFGCALMVTIECEQCPIHTCRYRLINCTGGGQLDNGGLIETTSGLCQKHYRARMEFIRKKKLNP